MTKAAEFENFFGEEAASYKVWIVKWNFW